MSDLLINIVEGILSKLLFFIRSQTTAWWSVDLMLSSHLLLVNTPHKEETIMLHQYLLKLIHMGRRFGKKKW